ncbi:uncharacterized protein TM35_000072130 [Trypanosoma theileri]|uniref:Uncharacterized protein n=1 Tax=Trypanosoma theileri TaxID=67003 RepID=A0A1X0P2M0_9TRYP|nr:uncharacterized protein TM35_000072130 [Trypanosoma theileri]ORC90789.1 hypothetical protein TM35_000072130 [Trypanosoma theileri]
MQMLNRVLGKRTLVPLATLVVPRRNFSATRFVSEKSNKTSMEQEDKEELERERQLRERFSEKIQEAMPQYGQQGSGNCYSGNCGAQPTSSSVQFFRFLFFMTSLFILMAFMQLSDTNSPFNIMQNIPWWQLPISSAAHFVLMRALLPFREQRRIKEEYETSVQLNPTLTLDQFFTQRYPTIFQGYRTQQQEVVAAVAACMATANDLRFARSISRAAGSARDVRASVDNIMDALRRDYPQLFQSSGGAVPPPSPVL